MNPSTQSDERSDQLIIRHPDGTVSKVTIPEQSGTEMSIGRELDNDVTLVDPRSSRHHAKIRRVADDLLEIADAGSANGTLLGATRLEANNWHPFRPGQTAQIGDTHLSWEQAVSSQKTVGMAPVAPQRPQAAPAAASSPQKSNSLLPILAIVGGVIIVLLLIWLIWSFSRPDQGPADVATNGQNSPANLTQQTPQGAAEVVDTPTTESAVVQTPLAPAYPVVLLEETEFLPVISGALFDTQHVYFIARVRVENLGDEPFLVSTDQFWIETGDGRRLDEFGQQFAESEFKRLGVNDRFEDLRLGSGGSVGEELVFFMDTAPYNLTLHYQPLGFDPLTVDLGAYDTSRELAILLGTPVPEATEVLVAAVTPTPEEAATPTTAGEETATATATTEAAEATGTPTEEATAGATEEAEATEEPTTTPTEASQETESEATPTTTATTRATPTTPRPSGPSRTLPPESLVGTIAFPDFNGESYDLYFGNVASGEVSFWRGQSSQPIFSHSGSRIAYHSWAPDSRGLITSNLDHTNGFLVTAFLEDQLPTWSPDDSQLLFLSRRTGTRQSELYKAPSNQERPQAQLVLEGEYPIWQANGTVVFKGWVTSGVGLRIASGQLTDYEPLTDNDADTGPSISPDGQTVVFMSRRDGNWDIYSIKADGSGLTRLTTDDADDGLPTWSPDGSAIAFLSNRGGPWAVWAMTPSGSGIRQLFTLQGSPDGFVASEPTSDTTRGWAEERISWTR